MTTLLSAPPSPIDMPTVASPGPSSFSRLAGETAGGPSRPLPTHRSPSQIRRSSQNASPPPNSLLLSSQTYERHPSPSTSTSAAESSMERGRTSTNGMLGVQWGSRRGSDTQLNELTMDVDPHPGRRSRSVSPRLGGTLALSPDQSGLGGSPLPSPRLPGRGSSFEDDGELRRPVKAWTLGQRSGSCDSSGTESSIATISSVGSASSASTTATTSTVMSSAHASTPSTTPLTYDDLALPNASSPATADMAAGVTGVRSKKDKKTGYGFGVLKGWLGKKDKDKGKERAKTAKVAGGLAPPIVLKESSRLSNTIETISSSSHRDGESDTDEDENDAVDDEDENASNPDQSLSLADALSSSSTIRLSPPSGLVPLPPANEPTPTAATRFSQKLLSPLQTFPFPSAFRRSSPPPPAPLDLPEPTDPSPTTPTAPGPPPPTYAPTPPTLNPLQSLHLLSSQKLSVLVRPPLPAHPIFVAADKKGSERRFPTSTNAVGLGRKTSRVRGFVVELGVRGLMRRLEVGGKASRTEIEALVRLFKARPVSLVRDASGGFIASISPSSPSGSEVSLDSVAPPNVSSSALRAAAPAAGSGVLAFVARPAFEERVVVMLPDPSSADGLSVSEVVTARGLGVMELEFSVGLEALSTEILIRSRVSGPAGRGSSLGLSLEPPRWRPTSLVDGGSVEPAGGRKSPTDGKRTGAEQEVAVRGPPKLPDVTLTPGTVGLPKLPAPTTPPSATHLAPPPAATSSSSEESSPTTPTQRAQQLPTPPLSSSPDLRPPVLASALRSRRFSPLSRQTYPSPVSPDLSAKNESAVDDENETDEDEVPLAVLKHRSSFVKANPSPPKSNTPSLPSTTAQRSVTRVKTPSTTRSMSKDRVRFSPDTIDREQREAARRETEAREREAREKEAERERARAEEEEKKRQEKLRIEVAATRQRREDAKLGTKKGNNGNWEDLSSGSSSGGPPRKQAKRSESSFTLRDDHARSGSGRRTVSTADLPVSGREGGGHHDRESSYPDRPPSLVSNTATSTPLTASPRSSLSSTSRIDPRPTIVGQQPKRSSFSSSSNLSQSSGLVPSTSPSPSNGSYTSSTAKFASPNSSVYSDQLPPAQHRHHSRASLYLPQTAQPPPQMMPTSFTSPHSLAMMAAGGPVPGYGHHPMMAMPQPMPYGYVHPYGHPQPPPVNFQPNFGYNPYFPNGFAGPIPQAQPFFVPPAPPSSSRRDSRTSFSGSMNGHSRR